MKEKSKKEKRKLKLKCKLLCEIVKLYKLSQVPGPRRPIQYTNSVRCNAISQFNIYSCIHKNFTINELVELCNLNLKE